MKKLTTIFFDLDGTLIDTAPDLAKALNQLLANYQRPTLEFAKIRPFASSGSKGLLKLGFNIEPDHPDFPQLRQEFLALYDDFITDQTVLFDGILDLINAIEALGLLWGIVTNKPSGLAEKLLQHFELLEHSACCIGGDQVQKPKPAPDSLLFACQQISVKPDECIYIGDHRRDIAAANAANMLAIAVLYGYIPYHENPLSWKAYAYAKNSQEILEKIKQLHVKSITQ